MGSWAALLGTFSSGFAARVLASLGMGFVSFAGYSVVITSLIGAAQDNWAGVGGDVLAYLSLAGFPTGFGIILGCVITRGSLMALQTLGKVT